MHSNPSPFIDIAQFRDATLGLGLVQPADGDDVGAVAVAHHGQASVLAGAQFQRKAVAAAAEQVKPGLDTNSSSGPSSRLFLHAFGSWAVELPFLVEFDATGGHAFERGNQEFFMGNVPLGGSALGRQALIDGGAIGHID